MYTIMYIISMSCYVLLLTDSLYLGKTIIFAKQIFLLIGISIWYNLGTQNFHWQKYVLLLL